MCTMDRVDGDNEQWDCKEETKQDTGLLKYVKHYGYIRTGERHGID